MYSIIFMINLETGTVIRSSQIDYFKEDVKFVKKDYNFIYLESILEKCNLETSWRFEGLCPSLLMQGKFQCWLGKYLQDPYFFWRVLSDCSWETKKFPIILLHLWKDIFFFFTFSPAIKRILKAINIGSNTDANAGYNIWIFSIWLSICLK